MIRWEGTRLRLRNGIGAFLISPGVIFLLLALAIMGPLLGPGRILTLDSLLAFNLDTAGYFWGTSGGPGSVFAATYNSAPVGLILQVFSLVVPFSVVEKAWLVLLFWLCGVGAFRLPYLAGVGRYYAGAFYAVNPFTYIRFVSGQWGILGAYALIPFAVTSFVRLLEEPNPRHAIKVALILTAIGFLQIHGLFLVCLLLGGLFLGRIAMAPRSMRNTLPVLLMGAVLFVGVNTFWIVRYAGAGGGVIQNMARGELSYFAAFPPLDVLSLRGSWLPPIYLDISDLVPVWWVLFLPLFALAIYGGIVMRDNPRNRWIALGLSVAGVASLILAAGPGVAGVESAFQWLWEHVPWYRAFRDSHKFVAILALIYAWLGALGLQALVEMAPRPTRWTRWLRHAGIGLVFALAIIYALPIFGAWAQIKPASFPEQWQQARSILDADSEDYNVLVLPWHMYMNFEWLPNRWKNLVNPAPSYFSQPVISGDNLEIAPNFSDSSSPQSRFVETLLARRESLRGFGSLIAPLNAKYVVLFNTADHASYGFLREQDDLEVIFDSETITLFRNLSPTARVYAADDVVFLRSLEDYINPGSPQDPLANLYVLGSESAKNMAGDQTGIGPVVQSNVVTSGPLSYRLEHAGGNHVVLALPQHSTQSGWTRDGQKSSLKNLDMMPAFPASPNSTTITFTRFYKLYLPAYILAAVSLLVAGLVYLRSPR